MTDIELIKALKKDTGSRTLWNEFYIRYYSHICLTIKRESQRRGYSRGINDFEDLAQNILKKLIENDFQALNAFKGTHENSFYKYLQVMCVRLVINSAISDKTRKTIDLDDVPDQGKTDMDQSWAQKEQLKDCIEQILGSNKNREMYTLILKSHFEEDYKAKEIAEYICKSVSSKRISNIISEFKPAVRDCMDKNE